MIGELRGIMACRMSAICWASTTFAIAAICAAGAATQRRGGAACRSLPGGSRAVVDGDTLAVRVAIWLAAGSERAGPHPRHRCAGAARPLRDEKVRAREATVALEAAGDRRRGRADGDRGRQIFRSRDRRCRDARRAKMSAPRSSPAAMPAPTTAARDNPGAEAISAASKLPSDLAALSESASIREALDAFSALIRLAVIAPLDRTLHSVPIVTREKSKAITMLAMVDSTTIDAGGDPPRGTADPPAHPADAGDDGRCGGLRTRGATARPQARASAACRLVQAARRLHQSSDTPGARGGRGRGVGRQSRRGGRLCGDAARAQGDDLRAEHRLAGKARPHPLATAPSSSSPASAMSRRLPRARSAPRRPARCRSTPTTSPRR